jgi:3-phosphoinositide dependent protein kinase-1
MYALRAHPFFASIHWDTLWDDPAPPLETGLVRREAAPVDEWDDVGATWDELVSGPDGSEEEDEEDGSVEGLHPHPNGNAHGHVRLRAPGDDGIEWAPDAQAFVSPPAIPPEEIGPHGEMPDYAPEALALADAVDAAEDASGSRDVQRAVAATAAATDANGSVVVGSYEMPFALPGIEGVSTKTPIIAAGMGEGGGGTHHPAPGPGNHHKSAEEKRESPASTSAGISGGVSEAPGTSAPLPIPRNVIRDSYATSSSDGSPVEKLGAALEAMGIHRGRLRTRSPTPARGAPASVEAPDWYADSPVFRASYLPMHAFVF